MDYDSTRLVTDIAGLDKLKAKAHQDPKGSLNEVARQFESLLVSMMVKSMRQAGDSLGSGILDSSQGRMYRDLYDQQLATTLAEHGGLGLADAIRRQLGGSGDVSPSGGKSLPDYLDQPLNSAAPASTGPSEPALDSPQRFVDALMPSARQAAAQLGVAPEALLAQAALETGWGRSVIHGSGGNNSHNLFGIKADGRWNGDQVAVTTLEYVDGVAVRRNDPFRAYGSYQQSFQDYVDFLRDNPRYRQALDHASDPAAFFGSLQRAVYASDPAYAEKILKVLGSGEMRAALERVQQRADLQAESAQAAGSRPASG